MQHLIFCSQQQYWPIGCTRCSYAQHLHFKNQLWKNLHAHSWWQNHFDYIALCLQRAPTVPLFSQGACSMSSAMSQCSWCHTLWFLNLVVWDPCFHSFRKSHGSLLLSTDPPTSSYSMFPLLDADPATTTIQSCSQPHHLDWHGLLFLHQ